MKRQYWHLVVIGALWAASGSLQAAETIRLNSKPGNLKVRVEGTSTLHDWRVTGKIIGGYMEVGPGFPLQPGAEVNPGKVEAKAETFIPVRSLASIKEDGSFDPVVPSPETALWFAVGSRAARHDEVLRYLELLAREVEAREGRRLRAHPRGAGAWSTSPSATRT